MLIGFSFFNLWIPILGKRICEFFQIYFFILANYIFVFWTELICFICFINRVKDQWYKMISGNIVRRIKSGSHSAGTSMLCRYLVDLISISCYIYRTFYFFGVNTTISSNNDRQFSIWINRVIFVFHPDFISVSVKHSLDTE